MPTRPLLSGETIEYDASEELAAFFERAEARALDPDASYNDLVDLLYGEENPLLIRGVIPGRGYVTAEILANPAYRVMLDLLDLKLVRTGRLDLAAAEAAHTVSVSEAAKRLGISTGAVRQAIAARRLHAVKRGGQYWLRPEGVASYKLSRKGPAASTERSPALSIRSGIEVDAVLHVRHDGEWEELAAYGGDGITIKVGEVTGWTWAAVKTARKDMESLRLFRIRPGPVENEVAVGDLYVRGRFEIIEKVNQAQSAAAAWKALPKPESA